MDAVALMVIEVETRSSGIPSKRSSMSGSARDGHPHLAHLAPRHGVVGVVAHLGGQVERHAEAGLPLPEEVAVAPVGLRRRAEARVLAHRPEAPAVHGGLDAARERVLAGKAEVAEIVEGGEVGRRVEGLDGRPAGGREEPRALRRACAAGRAAGVRASHARRASSIRSPRRSSGLGSLGGQLTGECSRASSGGLLSRLVWSTSRAWISRRRVSRGSITSST